MIIATYVMQGDKNKICKKMEMKGKITVGKYDKGRDKLLQKRLE